MSEWNDAIETLNHAAEHRSLEDLLKLLPAATVVAIRDALPEVVGAWFQVGRRDEWARGNLAVVHAMAEGWLGRWLAYVSGTLLGAYPTRELAMAACDEELRKRGVLFLGDV